MSLIIDAYNVLFAITHHGGKPIGDAIEEARTRLIEKLVRHHQETGEDVTLVFDSHQPAGGASRQESLPGVYIRYSHPPRTADDDILRLVETSTGPQHLRVVTSDRALGRACSKAGAEVVGAMTFYNDLTLRGRKADEDGKEQQLKNEPPSADEVREWLELFGDDKA